MTFLSRPVGPAARRFVARLARLVSLAGVAGLGPFAVFARAEADPVPPAAYEPEIRPLLARYCLDCHSTAKAKGDLDLERLGTLAEARRHPGVWQGVADQMAQGEMPPKEKPQPSPGERARIDGWIRALLQELAEANAGDPGPVVLRRLSNAEYTYTLRDLTGIPDLDPAREFPIDGAAGEGFMNTGNALVMSPALLEKYLDAARGLSRHLVLLPDGVRFSPHTSRRDWTDETVQRIRELYRRYTYPRGSTRVNLQGLVWDTNEGGRIPLQRYLAVLLETRDALAAGSTTPEQVARTTGLNARYLATLARTLTDPAPSLPLGTIRARFRTASPDDAAALASLLERWQQALWRFNAVGHIGKVGGPKSWMEPVAPLATRQELRTRLHSTNLPPGSPLTVRLTVGTAGDGSNDDLVLVERPRLVSPGRPDLPLRLVPAWSRELSERRARLAATTRACLAAAADAEAEGDRAAATGAAAPDLEALARRHGVDAPLLAAWLDFLGLGLGGPGRIEGHFDRYLEKTGGFDFVRGWGSPDTPSLVANASDQHVRIPGNLPGHSVAVHPSPTLQAGVSWQSPVATRLRVESVITHAHPECGNGVTWSLELRRGTTRQRLAAGVSQGGKPVRSPALDEVSVRPGDVVCLLIGPRDGNHACDLTGIDLTLTPTDPNAGPAWSLSREVSGDVLAGNPHHDHAGQHGVWHFHTEPVSGNGDPAPAIPAGSLLARWRSTADPARRTELAEALQALLAAPEAAAPASPAPQPSPDTVLRRQILSPSGPIFRTLLARWTPDATRGPAPTGAYARFGPRPDGPAAEADSLVLRAPAVLDFEIPAELAEGTELVTSAALHSQAGPEASAQAALAVIPGGTPAPEVATADPAAPVLVAESGPARRRIETDFDAFRTVFPAALAYTKIVPVDEVVTLTLLHREDDALRRLMLDDAEAAELDRLWDELHYVSQDALTLVDAFQQLWEYATQDADPKVFEPLRQPILDRAARFRELLARTEPRHLDGVVRFAALAYRRPLRDGEATELHQLYATLRKQELGHDDAVRLTLARVLVSPAFLYRHEQPGPGVAPTPVSDWELATRLSYFLWSSVPDAPLRDAAQAGRLRDPAVLAAECRRMLADPRVRRLATEFGCQWLHIHDFDQLNEKSERHFPAFASLRGAMYEEPIRFFTDFFAANRPVAALLEADYAFVNPDLAAFYGLTYPGTAGEDAPWIRVDGVRTAGRGGLLGFAATLARQSGASRTSPILRGNWISEVLLGERLPRPPKDVPRLPEDEAATEGLTVRQLVERHSQDPRCAGCHVRIDPYGYALEHYDAIGHRRQRDLGDRPIDTRTRTADGAELEGLDGLRDYLLHRRREAFLRQFCRKLTGYALGRAVQLSDRPLIDELIARIERGDGRIGSVVETLVLSRPFREIRGQAHPTDE